MTGLTLAVGNETLLSAGLVQSLKDRAGRGQRIYVVVPATLLRAGDHDFAHSEHLESGDAGSSESTHVSLARLRLEKFRELFRALGIEVQGEVGDPDPLVAVMAAVTRLSPDEVVVSTFSRRRSQWLRRDLPSQLTRALDIPVVVITPSPQAR